MLNALSPLDGRYSNKTEALRPFFSEEALIRARVEVEIRWFMALAAEPRIRELPQLKKAQEAALFYIIENFDSKQAEAVKKLEQRTNHDVKAVEYYLKEKMKKIKGLKPHLEFIHFGLTSEDVNNLSYGVLIHEALNHVIMPGMRSLLVGLTSFSRKWEKVQMLSMTHGQPATPTTVGKEFAVFRDAIEGQLKQLKAFSMQGKFGGAVGTYAAHLAAYPDFPWKKFGHKFVKSLGLIPLENTTQINPHDDIAQLSHQMVRINTVMIDLSQDMWLYISRGVFSQKLVAGEIGSSTMPHKVNPIDFENAEGNLGIANALFNHFAVKLPVSRMQRDLTDSTVQRSIGSAFGYHLIAQKSLAKGLSKISIDKKVLQKELDDHPEVLAEAIQMVLRKHGVPNAYEMLKELTRGEKITKESIQAFVAKLDLPKSEKERLSKMCK
ncbi:MAG: adenylosuccinate lyase [bacterium]|nr:adenylosuccinate lyase [bacterium]